MKELISILICLASIVIFLVFNPYWENKELILVQKEKDLLLLIGILSARENFKARESIRSTWLQNINKTLEKYYFLVGTDFCPIPISDRISEFSCEEWNVFLASGIDENTEIVSGEIKVDYNKKLDSSLNIFVHHKIVIRRLCILSTLVKNTTKVSIIDLSTGNAVISASFIYSDTADTFLMCKSVELFEFPKQFEGKIVIESLHNYAVSDRCNVVITDTSQILTYKTSLSRHNLSDICSPVSLVYTIQDAKLLEDHIHLKSKRKDNWMKQKHSEEKLLIEESRKYGDISFLNVTDVYRNLPTKILHFFKSSENQRINFQYFLKTDDDVFIDLQQVRSKLRDVGSLNNWWWSSFRENWPVQKFGKWRDDSYNSITYPPFPCGAGYILSADLAQFIARNADVLHCYQGEDVSLGIWLAPLNPTLQSDCWQCSQNVPNACNQPELTLENMYLIWKGSH